MYQVASDIYKKRIQNKQIKDAQCFFWFCGEELKFIL